MANDYVIRGNLKLTGPITDSASSSGTQSYLLSSTGTGSLWLTATQSLGYTPENIINKQNSLLTDGTGLKYTTVDAVKLGLRDKQNLPTGVIIGLTMSINVDNTKFNISPGAYVITDFTDIINIKVNIIEVTASIVGSPSYLTSSNSSYIALDVNKNIVQSVSPFTYEQRRTLCLVGNAVHSNRTNINIVNDIKAQIVAPTNQLHDMIKAVGFLNLSGNVITPNGANLSLNKSAGDIWGLGINGTNYLDPHKLTLPALTAFTFRYRLGVGTESSDRTTLDPTLYNPGGGATLTALSNNNRWSIQHFNIFQSGAIRAQYGQNEYGSFAEARNAVFTEPFVVETNIADNAIFRAYIVLKKTTTDLAADIASGDAEIISVDKFGAAIGSAGASLTYNNIISILGFVPESVSNKQNSLTVDGTGVKFPTVDALNSGLNTKISGTGATGQIGFWSGTNSQTGDSKLLWNNTSKTLTIDGTLETDTFEGTSSIDIQSTDLNTLHRVGFFKGNSLTNAPEGNLEWWYITVESHGSGWYKQTATSYGGGANAILGGTTYIRVYTDNTTWNPWQKLAFV